MDLFMCLSCWVVLFMFSSEYDLMFSLKLFFLALIGQVCSQVMSSRNYIAKDLNFGIGACATILQGVSEVVEVVKVTMEPRYSMCIVDYLYVNAIGLWLAY